MSPIYQYECEECEKSEEKMIGINQSDLEVLCPVCEKPMQKVYGASNFVIKGYSYKNGYSSTNKNDRK